MREQIVVVGAGQAAAQAIDLFRRRGFDGSIVLIGDEPHAPYQRPPLSKKYLAGDLPRERLPFRIEQFYKDHGVELYLGRKATEIDRGGSSVSLDDGSKVQFSKLLLATGCRARALPLPGTDLEGVHRLRSMADAERLRAELRPGLQLIVLGGGYIGLEVAATACALGLHVTVLEMAPRIMSRVVCATTSEFFQVEHARHGIGIECNIRVRAIAPGPGGTRAARVECEDGRAFPADLVLIGVGSAAVDEIAGSSGLKCQDGIVVDENCRTADERVYAAGDCTRHPSIRYNRWVRLESVDNAFEQGASAALNMMGTVTVHDRVPWFWSDQFDLKLIVVGLAHGADRTVVRGNPESRRFSVCYMRGDELLAIDTVNNAKDQMAARKIIAARGRVDCDRLVDPEIGLAGCLK